MSQVTQNPFKYTDSNKRYYTYNYYLKNEFGKKCAKIPLDAGFTCPNIDGKVGRGGCIYCSGGSYARVVDSLLPLSEQYRLGIEKMSKKWDTGLYIPYLQAYTNTYTTPKRLKEILSEIMTFESVAMIDIATRADCLDGEIVAVLDEVSQKIPLTVELGLQTSNDKTAKLINRCHDFEAFCNGYYALRSGAKNVKIGIHIINGLPKETAQDMKNTARSVAKLHPDLVKIHLLHVIKDTPLAKMYEGGGYIPMEREEYVSVVCDQLELLPPDTVIERVTGDGIESELLAPLWSKRKVCVINDIDKELFRRKTHQGILHTAKCSEGSHL